MDRITICGAFVLAALVALAWVVGSRSPYLFPPIEKRTIAECFNLEWAYETTAHFRLAPAPLLAFIAHDRSAEAWRAMGERDDNGAWHLACSAYFRSAAAYALRGDTDAKNAWGNHGLAAARNVETSYLMDIWNAPIAKERITNGGGLRLALPR